MLSLIVPITLVKDLDNCALFVSGYFWGQKIKYILLDGRFAINIMSKSTMNDLGITTRNFLRVG